MSAAVRTSTTMAITGASWRARAATAAIAATGAWSSNTYVPTTIAFGTHKHPRRRPRT